MKIRTDFVTNSSSAAFVCSTDKTPEEVKELVIKIIDLHNEIHNENYIFESILDEPYVYTENMLNSAVAEERKDRAGSSGNYYAQYGWGWGFETKKETVGCVMLFGSGDNSVPWEIMNQIESAFNARHYHLG